MSCRRRGGWFPSRAGRICCVATANTTWKGGMPAKGSSRVSSSHKTIAKLQVSWCLATCTHRLFRHRDRYVGLRVQSNTGCHRQSSLAWRPCSGTYARVQNHCVLGYGSRPDFDSPMLSDEEIMRFQVSMNDTLLVKTGGEWKVLTSSFPW